MFVSTVRNATGAGRSGNESSTRRLGRQAEAAAELEAVEADLVEVTRLAAAGASAGAGQDRAAVDEGLAGFLEGSDVYAKLVQ